MATTADLKNGITLEIESQLWTVVGGVVRKETVATCVAA